MLNVLRRNSSGAAKVACRELSRLTKDEVGQVAGGDGTNEFPTDGIVITGERWYSDPRHRYYSTNTNYNPYYAGGNSYSYGSGGSGGDASDESTELTPEETDPKNYDSSEEILQTKAVLDLLTDLRKEHGNVNVELPQGSFVSIDNLIDGMGKFLTLVEAGSLIVDIEQGDKNVQDAFHFVFGLTVGTAALSAGTSATVAGILGFGAEYAAGHVMDWMAAMGEANRQFFDTIDRHATLWAQSNWASGDGSRYGSEADFYRGMFGNGGNGDDYNYNIP